MTEKELLSSYIDGRLLRHYQNQKNKKEQELLKNQICLSDLRAKETFNHFLEKISSRSKSDIEESAKENTKRFVEFFQQEKYNITFQTKNDFYGYRNSSTYFNNCDKIIIDGVKTKVIIYDREMFKKYVEGYLTFCQTELIDKINYFVNNFDNIVPEVFENEIVLNLTISINRMSSDGLITRIEKINGREFHNPSAFSLEEIFHLEENESIVESLEYLENNSFQIEEKIFLIPYIISTFMSL